MRYSLSKTKIEHQVDLYKEALASWCSMKWIILCQIKTIYVKFG